MSVSTKYMIYHQSIEKNRNVSHSEYINQAKLTKRSISSSQFIVLIKSTWRDPGSYLLVFSSWWNRLDEIKYLVFLSTRPEKVDMTRSRILSSCLLILNKSTWQDSGSCLLVFSSWRSRLDEIQDLFFLSFRPEEVDLTRFRIFSSCLLVLKKSTRRDSGSFLLVFSSCRSRLDEIQDLFFLSSHPHQVDLTRSRILSFCLLVLTNSTWRDSGSYLLVFSSSSSRLDEIPDLAFLSSRPGKVDLTRLRILSFCLLASSSCLLDSFSRLLVFAPWFISSSGGTFKLPYSCVQEGEKASF